jgi:hypothetical protein
MEARAAVGEMGPAKTGVAAVVAAGAGAPEWAARAAVLEAAA